MMTVAQYEAAFKSQIDYEIRTTPHRQIPVRKIWTGLDFDALCSEAATPVACDGCNELFRPGELTEEREPQYGCTCIRWDVDRYDSRGCWACDPGASPRLGLFCVGCLAQIEPEIPTVKPITIEVSYPQVFEFQKEVA